MVEGLRLVQGPGPEAFSVIIERAGDEFEYKIAGRPEGVSMRAVAEILFSVALDIRAKEIKK